MGQVPIPRAIFRSGDKTFPNFRRCAVVRAVHHAFTIDPQLMRVKVLLIPIAGASRAGHY